MNENCGLLINLTSGLMCKTYPCFYRCQPCISNSVIRCLYDPSLPGTAVHWKVESLAAGNGEKGAGAGVGGVGQKKGTLRIQSALMMKKELLGAQDGVFGGLGDAEFHDALGGDLDGFAGGRIAAHARFAVDQDELAQTRQGEGVLGVLVSQIRNELENLGRGFLGNAVFLRDCSGDL